MATLPDPSQTKRVAPRPSMTVAVADTSAEGLAIANFGEKVSKTVTDLAVQEHKRLTETEAQNAVTKYNQGLAGLMYGDETTGEKGALTARGKGVVETKEGKSFSAGYLEKATKLRDDIGAGLSPAARRVFDPHAAAAGTHFQTNLLQHTARETTTYHVQSAREAIETGAALVAASGDEGLFSTQLQAVSLSAKRAAEASGVDVDAAVGKAYADVTQAYILGKVGRGDVVGAKKDIESTALKDKLGSHYLGVLQKVEHHYGQFAAASVASTMRAALSAELNPNPLVSAVNVANAAAKETGVTLQTKTNFNDLVKTLGVHGAFQALVDGPEKVKEAQEAARKVSQSKLFGPEAARLQEIAQEKARAADTSPEAKAFAKRATEMYNAGQGAVVTNVLEAENRAVAIARRQFRDLTFDQVEAVRTRAKQAYGEVHADQAQKQEAAFNDLYQKMRQGVYRSVDQIPREVWSQLGSTGKSVPALFTAASTEIDTAARMNPEVLTIVDDLKSQPHILASAPYEKLVKIAPTVGPRFFGELMEARAAYKKNPDALYSAKLDADHLRQVAEEAGLKGDGASAKAARARLRQYAESDIYALRKSGVAVDRAKEKEILDNHTKKVIVPWFLGLTKEVRAMDVKPGDAPSALVKAMEAQGVNPESQQGREIINRYLEEQAANKGK